MKRVPVLALALAFIGSPVFAQAPPCDGSYELFMGKSTAEAQPGNPLPNAGRVAQGYNNREGWAGVVIPKPHSEGLHEVKVSQCGRQFVLSKGGKRMVFLQSVADETVYVAQDIGTAKATMTVRVVGHRLMAGLVAGASHGFEFNLPMAMEPREISMPNMEGCARDTPPEEKETDATRTTGEKGLSEALALQGKAPAPGHALSDYVQASKEDDGRQNTWLNLGLTGRILPAEPSKPSLEDICTGDGTLLLDPPRVRLNFKQIEVEGEILVFVQVIDIETGVIREQREAVAASPASGDRAHAMSAALSRLDTHVGAPSDGYSDR